MKKDNMTSVLNVIDFKKWNEFVRQNIPSMTNFTINVDSY